MRARRTVEVMQHHDHLFGVRHWRGQCADRIFDDDYTNRAASRLDVGGAVVVGVVPKCATHVLGRDGIRVREGRPRADIDEDVVSRRGRRDMEAVRV